MEQNIHFVCGVCISGYDFVVDVDVDVWEWLGMHKLSAVCLRLVNFIRILEPFLEFPSFFFFKSKIGILFLLSGYSWKHLWEKYLCEKKI